MKYRFRQKKSPHAPRPRSALLRLRGRDMLRPLPPSGFYRLHDPEPFLAPIHQKETPLSRLRRILHGRLEEMRKRRSRKKERLPLWILQRACLAAGICVFLTLSVILLTVFAPLGKSYTLLTVPHLEGRPLSEILASAKTSGINLIVQYEKNPTVPAGTVISQIPRGGVRRRLYSDKDYTDVVLTVSQSPTSYSLESLTGLSLRDARLILCNHALDLSITEEYSSRPAGTVISSNPSAGTELYEGDRVTLRVSLGSKPSRAYVPELYGCSESEARERLAYAGLSVGDVRYVESTLPAGTVVAQQYPAHTVLGANASVSFSVSLGDRYALRLIPDLYGLSEQEAALCLREYGLTVGSVYSVGNAAPQGTVISQSPPKGTPITSSVWSVDLFVSAP